MNIPFLPFLIPFILLLSGWGWVGVEGVCVEGGVVLVLVGLLLIPHFLLKKLLSSIFS